MSCRRIPPSSFWGTDSYVASKYYLSGNNKREHTEAYKSSDKGINWQVANKMLQSERDKLLHLEQELHLRVVGHLTSAF